MKKVDMKYSFYSQEEPTDEQLHQLMKEACQKAVSNRDAALIRYFEQMKETAKVAKENFKKQYGIA